MPTADVLGIGARDVDGVTTGVLGIGARDADVLGIAKKNKDTVDIIKKNFSALKVPKQYVNIFEKKVVNYMVGPRVVNERSFVRNFYEHVRSFVGEIYFF